VIRTIHNGGEISDPALVANRYELIGDNRTSIEMYAISDDELPSRSGPKLHGELATFDDETFPDLHPAGA
jgi:hypothetical protein